jgi:hypothetical protein
MANEPKRPYESNDPNRTGKESERKQPGSDTERERSGRTGSPDADRDRWGQESGRPGGSTPSNPSTPTDTESEEDR